MTDGHMWRLYVTKQVDVTNYPLICSHCCLSFSKKDVYTYFYRIQLCSIIDYSQFLSYDMHIITSKYVWCLTCKMCLLRDTWQKNVYTDPLISRPTNLTTLFCITANLFNRDARHAWPVPAHGGTGWHRVINGSTGSRMCGPREGSLAGGTKPQIASHSRGSPKPSPSLSRSVTLPSRRTANSRRGKTGDRW